MYVCMYVCAPLVLCIVGYILWFSRLEKLLKCDGSYAMGGETDKDDLYIAPTIITHVSTTDAIMCDEVRFSTLHYIMLSTLTYAR